MKLFLDDERFPANTENVKWVQIEVRSYPILAQFSINPADNLWYIARTVNAAVSFCIDFGCPEFITFDHDLQTHMTGKDFANWLVNKDLDTYGKFFPDNFKYEVHSQNVNGAANIKGFLDNYFAERSKWHG